jgi:predicted site-specific integrase-resolvase
MKAKEVLKLLRITRPTLCKYNKIGLIKGKLLPSGFYDYDKESVFKLLNKDVERVNVAYCRVSTNKQKNDLENQIEIIKAFCNKNGIILKDIYKDIGSGINFDRKEFQRLLNDVIQYKIDKIFITYKDRLSRISFQMFKNLFQEFSCEIVVLNEIDDEKIIEKEIFNEIIDLIHCFSMKVYSNRRKEKLKLIEKDLRFEDEINI